MTQYYFVVKMIYIVRKDLSHLLTLNFFKIFYINFFSNNFFKFFFIEIYIEIEEDDSVLFCCWTDLYRQKRSELFTDFKFFLNFLYKFFFKQFF